LIARVLVTPYTGRRPDGTVGAVFSVVAALRSTPGHFTPDGFDATTDTWTTDNNPDSEALRFADRLQWRQAEAAV
tara:strand:- start:2417 stop:2641 length:225 start_codon:yes stop_codon:yes gene_type:complete